MSVAFPVVTSPCPFCNGQSCMPVSNSVGQHWVLCTACRASGPHKASAEDAVAAWVVAPQEPRFPSPSTFLAGLFGGKR